METKRILELALELEGLLHVSSSRHAQPPHQPPHLLTVTAPTSLSQTQTPLSQTSFETPRGEHSPALIAEATVSSTSSASSEQLARRDVTAGVPALHGNSTAVDVGTQADATSTVNMNTPTSDAHPAIPPPSASPDDYAALRAERDDYARGFAFLAERHAELQREHASLKAAAQHMEDASDQVAALREEGARQRAEMAAFRCDVLADLLNTQSAVDADAAATRRLAQAAASLSAENSDLRRALRVPPV